VARLAVQPSGLYEVSWRAAAEVGRVQVARHDGSFIDCGTPEQYLAANLEASGGASVIGAGADVQGSVIRSVVWPDTEVRAGETLVDAIRYEADNRTVLVRRAG
jgi:mannose-1-phosphate guanylyltransferase/MurNAc alpha-1-phosphate uridylyltransferase